MKPFKYCIPVYVADKSKIINCQTAYRTVFDGSTDEFSLVLTGSTLYRVWLNGVIIHYGPARAPHGYVRVDRINFRANADVNTLVIEVAGYNCPSFYTMNIESFIQAELYNKDKCIRFTGLNGGFTGVSLDKIRETRVLRYSYQRAFTETWKLDRNLDDSIMSLPAEPLSEVLHVREYLERVFPYPKLDIYSDITPYEHGNTASAGIFNKYDKRFTRISTEVVGYPINQCPDDVLSDMFVTFHPDDNEVVLPSRIGKDEYINFRLGRLNAGFIRIKLRALVKSTVYIYFSEKLTDGIINCGVNNEEKLDIIKLDLKPTTNDIVFESFECYSLMYIGIRVLSGIVEISDISLREYICPLSYVPLNSGDAALDKTYEAAFYTFCQNSVDTFTDCPGRERAGWLCDSYFTAKAAYHYTGSLELETAFLTDFLLAKNFPTLTGGILPEGLLPMCYPGEITTGDTINQWTMWFILELGEFAQRGGDYEKFADIIKKALAYLEHFENSDNLLESLEQSQFIEASAANYWVNDVNYPTNMLYTKVLETSSVLLEKPELSDKADHIKTAIIKQSFDGRLFRDHAVRSADGSLVVLDDRSNICQLEAVLFDIIDIDDSHYSTFLTSLLDSFKGLKVEPLAGFIGYAVRILTLLKMGQKAQVINEIRETYAICAMETTTLWETMFVKGSSLSHGFASFIGAILADILVYC